jgi:hypothetical protein
VLYAQLREGVKFIDPGLLSSPAEYRLHRVTKIGTDEMEAVHLASGNLRRFALEPEVLGKLQAIDGRPSATATMDGLVGERVKIVLVNATSVTGIVTAVRYHEVPIDGGRHRSPREIELDRSGTTSYQWHEIKTIETLPTKRGE